MESEARSSTVVGRDAELSQLEAVLAEVRQSGELLVLVEGQSGVGKAAILRELRARQRLEGGVVLEGRCDTGGAFGPFADIVDGALRFLEQMGRAGAVALPDLQCRQGCHRYWYQHRSDREESPSAQGDMIALAKRVRFFDAVRGLLCSVASVRTPVVLMHGLERADRGTLELIQFLLDGPDPLGGLGTDDAVLRALFVASLRTDRRCVHTNAVEALRSHAKSTAITVGELDESGVRAYLQSQEAVMRVLERTGGMPEAIDLLLEGSPLTPSARVERILAAQPPGARAWLEVLSVIERPADAELLARVGGLALNSDDLTAFGDSGLVQQCVVDGAILFSFRRETDRELAYAALDDTTRRGHHERCVEAFWEKPGREQEAVHHAIAAGQAERAVPLALEAARSLAARHAHAEAAVMLESVALHAAPDTRVGLLEYLAELHRVAGDYKSALDVAKQVRSARPESWRAAKRVGEVLILGGDLDEAADCLADARLLARAVDDPAAETEVCALLAELHYQRASYEEAHEVAETALAAARGLGELALELQSRNTLGKLELVRRAPQAAAATFAKSREAAGAAGLTHQEAQALTNYGVALLMSEDLGPAAEAFTEAVSIAAAAGDLRDEAIATENLAVLAHLQCNYTEARERYHEAVALLKRLGNRAMLARVAINLGELYLSLGDRTRATSLCDFASHVGGTQLPHSITGEGLVLRGRVEAAHGHTEAARCAFEAARRIYGRLGEGRVVDPVLELVQLALADGKVDEARQALAGLPDELTSKRAARVAIVQACLARSAGERAVHEADRAVQHADAAGNLDVKLEAAIHRAQALADDGEIDGARAAVDAAYALEQQLTERVPEQSLDAWATRPLRATLDAIHAQLATVWPGAGARTSRPPSSRAATDSLDPRTRRWRGAYPNLIGDSAPMATVKSLLDRAAPTDALVLIRGESGTGKELVAEALHTASPRDGHPFVRVNCAALVETLLLSELFGHERGAFTGASATKKGRFELAHGGTIFLDEIGDISPKTQVALLRVLQERTFERVGGTRQVTVDVRILAATHRDLEAMVREGTFREDLYYRLRGVSVQIPALRDRVEDIPDLCTHLLECIARERDTSPKLLSPEALTVLAGHSWPGNVRELDNVLRSATLFADSAVLIPENFAAFAETFGLASDPAPQPSVSGTRASVPAPIEDMVYRTIRGGDHSLFEMKKVIERECIVRALRDTEGNITRAAELLGMKRPRLSQLVKQYNLTVSSRRSS